jgi:hypothetical protein
MQSRPRPAHTIAFTVARQAILALPNVDRAYLRRWVLRYVAQDGQIIAQPVKAPATRRSTARR